MTNNFKPGRRFPAEWEHHGAVLLALPHKDTDWAYMLDEVIECYRNLISAITVCDKAIIVTLDVSAARNILQDTCNNDNAMFVELPTNDTWARDFGPLTVEIDGETKLLDFQFNGWGLKFAANNDNLVTLRMAENGYFSVPVENHRGFVLEGGSVESDGNGLILTTSECLLSPNRNAELTREDITGYLKSVFGARKVLWLDHGALSGDDTDSHIDTLCRLAPNDTILYTGTSRTDDEHYSCLDAMRQQLQTFTTIDGKPFNLIELPLPDAIIDDFAHERLPATYANYLVLGNRILMPTYNQPMNDRLAADTLRIAFPSHSIIPVDCRALIRQHGSLHCVTMQLPVKSLNLCALNSK